MGLQKQGQTFAFGHGLALKDNVDVIPFGKFQSLSNCIFDTLGQFTKRNGFGTLNSTIGSISYLTTFDNNLIGLAGSIQSYSGAINQFINKGSCPNVQLSTVPLSNVLFGQSYSDVAISNNGLMCQVSTQPGPGGLLLGPPYTWTVFEQATGQVIAGPTQIVSSGGTQNFSPRVFSVGSQFVILYNANKDNITAASQSWLEYVTIPTSSPFVASNVFTISSNFSASAVTNTGPKRVALSFDAAVVSTSGLYVVWTDSTAAKPSSTVLNPVNNTQSNIVSFGTAGCDFISVTGDYTTTPYTMWTAGAVVNTGFVGYSANTPAGVLVGSSNVRTNGSGTIAISSITFTVLNVAMTAQQGSMTAYVEVANSYKYDDTIKSNVIYAQSVGTAVNSSVSVGRLVSRGLGLASHGFIVNSSSYVLTKWLSPFQSTYFLINSTGQVQAKLAYGNASPAGYYTQGLPGVSIIGSSSYVPYLFQTTVQPVGNKTSVGSQSVGIYGPLGVNLAQFNFGTNIPTPKEIGNSLVLGGGFLGSYDGQQFTENDFFLFPDSLQVIGSGDASRGFISPQPYFYQAIYEWIDNKGNIFRSTPSIPAQVNISSGTALNTVHLPMLRNSYKNYPYGGLNTPAQIKLFRWSAAQPIYYLTANYVPLLSDINNDSTTFFDGRSDSQIIGGEILYTNGGTVEDVNGPATKAMTTFDSRLWLIDGEDQNLLWFSKQVIENTPVEMSDLFTFYVAPNVGAEGPTGVMNCLAPMDDKLIIFKESALYYINGVGPDNTGAQNQYSQPIFITSGVGCSNQNSIVLIPNGLMFQSNKGIWLLGRDLSTTYIGKDVEALANIATVLSAITIPNTNQVRFTLNTGITLMYDYFVGEWGTFQGIPGISSVLYQNKHTFVNSSSSVFQETPGIYQDGLNPTLMSFTTGWVNLAGLQGYKRAYKAYLLGTYFSPHNFTMSIGYDYNSAITQTITVNPTNTVGSGSQVEQWQLNFQNPQCQSFQLTFNEVASQSAGQGLSLTGLDLVYGTKKAWPGNLPIKNRST